MASRASTTVVAARSTPHGFWRFAANYLLAARAVEPHLSENGQLFFPLLQLYATSIELSIKAFLLQRGRTLDEVKALGHRLSKALALARRHRMGRWVKLTRQEEHAIRALDIIYSSHQLRYIVSGSTKVPHVVELARATRDLVLGLELLCTGQRGRFDPDSL